MWDMLTYIVPPASTVIVLASILYYMSRLVLRWQRLRSDRKANRQRLATALMQEPQRVKWTCRRCKVRHYGLLPMGPVCRDCWQALDAYLQEVA